MYHRMIQDQQSNPLLPGYSFNAYLVAGMTPILADGPLDFSIDRPGGMKGYILNLTVKGQGKVFDGEDTFYCNPGDLLLFPPKARHLYARSSNSDCWYHRWVYFRPRAYWADWLEWHTKTRDVGRLSLPNNTLLLEFDRLFANIEQTQKSGRRFGEELGMNLLERLLLRAMEEDPQSPQKIMDPRVIEACQFITGNLAGELRIDEVARHVCLSPSRLAHLFREQVGINILRWREDQRVIRAKLLLQTTQESIATIGRVVGYDDQLYFSRVFRKRVGVSPSDFRRRSIEINYPAKPYRSHPWPENENAATYNY
ncbi:arabinose operon transcriptional regulator AraC [Rouxiella badensis]|jgi:AraC family transcriptional regulator of arabinose operon|uniref:Arabinose operon regulatory protein n=1 Tax=Rouxiella badensis TaxID=1646377 RepID=A0A1X0WH23_9GAMM|nr:arabinose operon transcriptional regulator AraC [Rouxiella badensis]MCC3701930.1 arabinose operon transcriptional regulator AraC [Rouxiella badensis]MCC3718088.1 arabinose operon transcriptional regulator AraC [Rouxiella badensis]MCC3727144.1 arabinose operon transcriptional regulator AraC [Rouxiella badensis]MCC3731572.1 arabinose operon transcriptional regulator AraC [Rouxiella badensis]MCC3738507.1 arabinose operon transcriptional regulator AraC [Rouxiella badensis]